VQGTTPGKAYTGINLTAGGITDVHAEPIALAKAVEAGDADIKASVAVVYEADDATQPIHIVLACGVYRELLHTFTPVESVIE
jgi:cytidine deaminase